MKDTFRVTRRAGRLLGTAAAATAIAASAVAIAGPAQAATNPYTAQKVCGSGYHELEHHSIPGAVVHLMWNGADNCVATIKTSNIGKKTETEAILEVKSSPTGFYTDEGDYAYYAAIKERAAGYCIKWGGMTTGIWESPAWGHCG
jgi:hypothetical protein